LNTSYSIIEYDTSVHLHLHCETVWW